MNEHLSHRGYNSCIYRYIIFTTNLLGFACDIWGQSFWNLDKLRQKRWHVKVRQKQLSPLSPNHETFLAAFFSWLCILYKLDPTAKRKNHPQAPYAPISSFPSAPGLFVNLIDPYSICLHQSESLTKGRDLHLKRCSLVSGLEFFDFKQAFQKESHCEASRCWDFLCCKTTCWTVCQTSSASNVRDMAPELQIGSITWWMNSKFQIWPSFQPRHFFSNFLLEGLNGFCGISNTPFPTVSGQWTRCDDEMTLSNDAWNSRFFKVILWKAIPACPAYLYLPFIAVTKAYSIVTFYDWRRSDP